MQDDPVNLIQILEHAARFHGEVQIVFIILAHL